MSPEKKPSATQEARSPISQTPTQELTPPPEGAPTGNPSFLDRAKAGAAEIAANAKAAAQLTVKQAERTKIVQLSLPGAYAELGKHLHATGTHRQECKDVTQAIDKSLGEMRAIESHVKSQPKPKSIADQAKSVASAAKEMAQSQALQVRLRQLYAELGKVVFEKHGEQAAAPEFTQPIRALLARSAQLDSEIATQPTLTRAERVKIVIATGGSLFLLIGFWLSAFDSSVNHDMRKVISQFKNFFKVISDDVHQKLRKALDSDNPEAITVALKDIPDINHLFASDELIAMKRPLKKWADDGQIKNNVVLVSYLHQRWDNRIYGVFKSQKPSQIYPGTFYFEDSKSIEIDDRYGLEKVTFEFGRKRHYDIRYNHFKGKSPSCWSVVCYIDKGRVWSKSDAESFNAMANMFNDIREKKGLGSMMAVDKKNAGYEADWSKKYTLRIYPKTGTFEIEK